MRKGEKTWAMKKIKSSMYLHDFLKHASLKELLKSITLYCSSNGKKNSGYKFDNRQLFSKHFFSLKNLL
jgi:hypothetical protein